MNTQKTLRRRAAIGLGGWTIYKFIVCFFICGCIGWIYETTIMWINLGHYPERGFLFVMEPLPQYLPFLADIPIVRDIPLIWGLPIILIYGTGGTLMCFLFRNWPCHPVLLFFAGMGLLTLVELAGSYMSDTKYWDYSGYFMNFQGRICLYASVVWGLLSVVAVKWVDPFIDLVYTKTICKKGVHVILWLLVAYTCVCAYCKYELML